MADNVGVNLLPNSSFEQGLDGWNVFTAQDSTREVVQGPRGQKAVKITRHDYTGSLRTGICRKPAFSKVATGDEFTISAWVRVDEKPEGFNRNAIFLRNSPNGDKPIISIPNSAEVGKWVKYSNTYTVEKDSSNIENVYILLGTNGAFSVSELKLERGGYQQNGLLRRRILSLW